MRETHEVLLSKSDFRCLEDLKESGVNLDGLIVDALDAHLNDVERLEDDMEIMAPRFGGLDSSTCASDTQRFLDQWAAAMVKISEIVQVHIGNGHLHLASLFLELTCMRVRQLPDALASDLCLADLRNKFGHLRFEVPE